MLVQRSLLTMICISMSCGGVQKDELYVLHDSSLSQMEIQWSQLLESLFREFQNRFPHVTFRSANVAVKKTVSELAKRNLSASVIITRCTNTQRLSEYWFVQPKALFIDLEPCRLPNRTNSVPLMWAKAKPKQFAHTVETWVQNWQYKRDKPRTGFNDFSSMNLNLSIFTSIEEIGRVRLNGSHLRIGTVYPICEIVYSVSSRLRVSHRAAIYRISSKMYNKWLIPRGFTSDSTFLVILTTQLISFWNFKHPPVSFKRDLANGSISFYGPLMELLQIYKTQLNFTYTLVYPPSGRGTGKMVALALQGDLDILLLLAFMGEKGQPVYTTYALYLSEFGILIPPPEVKRNLYSSLKPFTYEVWLSVLAGCVLIALLIWTSKKLQQSLAFSYETAFCNVFSVALNQGGSFPAQLATRFLATGWCLALVVLVNSYSSLLTSFITVPVPVPLVDSLEDLATQGRIKPSTTNNTILTLWLEAAAQDPSPSLFKTYFNIFNKHPEYYARDLFEGGEKFFQGGSGFIDRKEALEYVAALDFATTRKCRSMIAKRRFRPYMTSIGFRVEFPYIRTFNTIMMRTLEVGLRNHWDRLYVLRNPCRPLDIVLAETPVLTNQDLRTAYLILGVGSVLSIITILLECACSVIKLCK